MKTRFFHYSSQRIVFVSCSTQMSIKVEFEKNFRSYNELVRWHQLEEASLFPAIHLRRIQERRAKNVVVVDFRIFGHKI